MQSVTDEAVFFRVHCPTTKPLLLDIFSNIVSTEHYLLGKLNYAITTDKLTIRSSDKIQKCVQIQGGVNSL